MGQCLSSGTSSICLWSSRTCRWRWWWYFTWRFRLRVYRSYSSAFVADSFVSAAFENSAKSQVASVSADAVASVELSVVDETSRTSASVTDDTDEIEVTYSVYVAGDEDDVRRTVPAAGGVTQQQVDSLSANLAQNSAEDYTQSFMSEMNGVAGVASFGVTSVANSATAPTVTAQNDSPTASPTPSPTPSAASAVGDPHLVNIYGQRFDLMQPGLHSLVHIPRFAEAVRTLLDIQADVQRLGATCADMYVQSINVTGAWASAPGHPAGIFFSVTKSGPNLGWQKFGQVKLKVVQGHTESGIAYLNFLIRSLSKVDNSIGGLLGDDDHTDASRVDPKCRTRVNL